MANQYDDIEKKVADFEKEIDDYDESLEEDWYLNAGLTEEEEIVITKYNDNLTYLLNSCTHKSTNGKSTLMDISHMYSRCYLCGRVSFPIP